MNNKEIANDQIEVDRIKEVRKEDSKKQVSFLFCLHLFWIVYSNFSRVYYLKIFLLNIICKRLDESGEQSILLAMHCGRCWP
jgi:hypothetical protein